MGDADDQITFLEKMSLPDKYVDIYTYIKKANWRILNFLRRSIKQI